MIKINNVTKKYGDRTILDKINYTFNDTGIYVIKGYNGCGKTTLLKIVSFIDKNIEGNIEIDGINYQFVSNKNKDKFRKENIEYIKTKNNILSFTSCKEFINLFSSGMDLELVKDIDPNKSCKEISGGEEILVALTKTINSKKKILLLDEISAQLDDINLSKVLIKLDEIKNKKLIIFVTHDKRILQENKNFLIELEGGHLYDRGK